MPTANDVKETIIQATTDLIQQSGGEVTAITTRKIAEKANVGLGLINYHFGSKENLIAICVQRIISGVVSHFSPDHREDVSDEERLADWATQVFDFLFANPAISRISILNDLQNYEETTNSVHTQQGFVLALQGIPDAALQKRLTFLLVCAMQTAFLGGKSMHAILGYNFDRKDERDAFIRDTVAMLFHGIVKRQPPEKGEGQ